MAGHGNGHWNKAMGRAGLAKGGRRVADRRQVGLALGQRQCDEDGDAGYGGADDDNDVTTTSGGDNDEDGSRSRGGNNGEQGYDNEKDISAEGDKGWTDEQDEEYDVTAIGDCDGGPEWRLER